MPTERSMDSLDSRIKFIKNLIKGCNIVPMCDFKQKNKTSENIGDDMSNEQNNSGSGSSDTHDDDNDDIRFVLNKQKYNFNKIITKIGGKLCYIKSGTTGHTFKGINILKNGEEQNYAVKVVAYPAKENYGTIYNKNRPENAELMMCKILSEFVIGRHTPFIILPIITFNTSIETFIHLAKKNIIKNNKYAAFIKRYNEDGYHPEVSILISEWANGGDLLDYLRKNYKKLTTREWRVIFFQILSVLAIIHRKYPTFRHNDMKANNILVQKIDASNETNNKYKHNINGQTYIVPNIGILLKLCDFDFATIPGVVDNAKVEADWTKRINVTPEGNRYYDIHYFCNTLTKQGFLSDFYEAPEVPKAVKEFMRRVVPMKYAQGQYCTDRGRIKINKEIHTPDSLLKNDEFFHKMRVSN